MIHRLSVPVDVTENASKPNVIVGHAHQHGVRPTHELQPLLDGFDYEVLPQARYRVPAVLKLRLF